MSIEDKIAEVLAEHQRVTHHAETLGTPGTRQAWVSCRCGWVSERTATGDFLPWRDAVIAAHQAAMLAPHLREACLAAQVDVLRRTATGIEDGAPERPAVSDWTRGLTAGVRMLRATADRIEKEA